MFRKLPNPDPAVRGVNLAPDGANYYTRYVHGVECEVYFWSSETMPGQPQLGPGRLVIAGEQAAQLHISHVPWLVWSLLQAYDRAVKQGVVEPY